MNDSTAIPSTSHLNTLSQPNFPTSNDHSFATHGTPQYYPPPSPSLDRLRHALPSPTSVGYMSAARDSGSIIDGTAPRYPPPPGPPPGMSTPLSPATHRESSSNGARSSGAQASTPQYQLLPAHPCGDGQFRPVQYDTTLVHPINVPDGRGLWKHSGFLATPKGIQIIYSLVRPALGQNPNSPRTIAVPSSEFEGGKGKQAVHGTVIPPKEEREPDQPVKVLTVYPLVSHALCLRISFD